MAPAEAYSWTRSAPETGLSPTATSHRSGGAPILLVLFGLFIVYGTLLPFDFSAPREQVEVKRHAFFAKTLARASRTDVISNVLLFLPWGGLMAVWLHAAGGPRHGPGGGDGQRGCAERPGGGASALRTFADLLLDRPGDEHGGLGPGAVLGWLLARVIWPRLEADLKSQAARRPLAVLTAVSALGVLVASLAPFDVSLDVGDIKASVRGRAAGPVPPDGRPPAAAGGLGMGRGRAHVDHARGSLHPGLAEARFTGLRAASSP